MTVPSMLDHYVDLIAEMDKTIALVRGFWIESTGDSERKKNLERLNQLLDERLRLMKGRDAAAALLPKGQSPAAQIPGAVKGGKK